MLSNTTQFVNKIVRLANSVVSLFYFIHFFLKNFWYKRPTKISKISIFVRKLFQIFHNFLHKKVKSKYIQIIRAHLNKEALLRPGFSGLRCLPQLHYWLVPTNNSSYSSLPLQSFAHK